MTGGKKTRPCLSCQLKKVAVTAQMLVTRIRAKTDTSILNLTG